MRQSSSVGPARGAYERASRAAFKQLEKPVGGDISTALEALEVAELALQDVRAAIVSDLRSAGWSWADVGDALGVSRQSAWERYGRE